MNSAVNPNPNNDVLLEQPADTISGLAWSPAPQASGTDTIHLLAASSWDGQLLCYRVAAGSGQFEAVHVAAHKAPILDVAWQNVRDFSFPLTFAGLKPTLTLKSAPNTHIYICSTLNCRMEAKSSLPRAITPPKPSILEDNKELKLLPYVTCSHPPRLSVASPRHLSTHFTALMSGLRDSERQLRPVFSGTIFQTTLLP